MTASAVLWTKAETASFFKVSTRTIDNWCAARLLPFVQCPGGKRFDPEKLRDFVRTREFAHPSHSTSQPNVRVS